MTRARLLDAVNAELRERDWADVTMAQIAKTAGVSRQTVYNEFGSRDELAQAYVLWEADRFLTSVTAAVDANLDNPVAALTAAFDVFLDGAREHPLLRKVAANDPGVHELLPLLTTKGQPLHAQATANLGAVLADRFPDLGLADARLLSDAVVRLAISHAAMPADSPQLTARALGKLLGPFVEQVLSSSQVG